MENVASGQEWILDGNIVVVEKYCCQDMKCGIINGLRLNCLSIWMAGTHNERFDSQI